MQTGYFNAAWQDIKNSPGWFGKLLLLSLVSLIPVFGWIVVYGYLYGWARDIAWGVHAPLPPRVFGNEDGRLYSRGFFALVIAFVCALVPGFVSFVGSMVTGVGMFGYGAWMHDGNPWMHMGFAPLLVGMLFSVASVAVSLLIAFFQWVGTMRMSVYGRLSAGFQLGRIWAMIRHDFGGLLRILGMALILSLAMSIAISVLVFAMVLVGLLAGLAATGGNLNINADHIDGAVAGMVFAVIAVVLLFALLAGFASMAISVFISAMVARALGYWTRQFDVPAWRGQDDPMPFELGRGAYPNGGRPPIA